MIAPKRKLHRWMWLALTVVIPLVLLLALTQREAVPVMKTIPLELSE